MSTNTDIGVDRGIPYGHGKLLDIYRPGAAGEHASLRAVAQPLCTLRGMRNGQPDVGSLRMLRRARDRIDRDYSEDIGIAALATGAGYSREHFIRAFRAAYGETPGRYRTRRRIERACELLRSVNLTVTEICHLVGFTSLGTFSTRFAEHTGMSPSRYRAEATSRGGPAPVPGCFVLMWEAGLPAGDPREGRTS